MKTLRRLSGLTCVVASIFTMNVACQKDYGYNFENGYNSGEFDDTVSLTIDTNRFKIDYSKYTQARLFPGLVGEKETRLENHKVEIDLNYEELEASDLRISVSPGAWQSTSMYAPAGELIVIDVPVGVYGLTAQIGAHVNTSADGIPFPQRDLVIYSKKVLFPGKNYMRNLYGGLVYIIPARPLGKKIELEFSGTVKAPSFKLGVTTDEEWKDMVSKTTVPWFELEGNRIVFTIETAKLKKYPIPNPTELMEQWDSNIRRAYWDWTGLTEGNPDIRHRAPFNKWRIVHDVLFKDGVAQVSGYPVRARNNESYFKQAVTLEDAKYYNWGTYHELGHNMQMNSTWNFDGNGEVTNNLFSFKISMLNGSQSYKIAEVWNKAVPYIAANKHKGSAKDSINWSSMDVDGNTYKGSAHDIRLMMYAQIFEKYGYDFMTHIYKRARNARFLSANNQSKVDFFYEALSEFAKTDMELYLNKGWGLYPSTVSKKYVSETLGLPALEYDVWNFNPVTKTGGNTLVLEKFVSTSWTALANSEDVTRSAQNILNTVATDMWHPCTLSGSTSTCGKGSVQTPAAGSAFTWVINIDTKSLITSRGFHLLQRHNGNANHLKQIKLEISENGTDWQDLGKYSLEYGASAVGKDQFIYFNQQRTTKNLRYARISIDRLTDVNGDANAALNGFGFFK